MNRTYKIAERILKSFFVDTFTFNWGDKKITAQLLKNESNDMKDGDRGVMLIKNGDIYNVKLVNPSSIWCFAIHDNIIEELIKQKIIPKCNYANYKIILNVVRQNNKLYLGESYNASEIDGIVKSKEVANMINKFNSKNNIQILLRKEHE